MGSGTDLAEASLNPRQAAIRAGRPGQALILGNGKSSGLILENADWTGLSPRQG